jgi:hypothetical protein
MARNYVKTNATAKTALEAARVVYDNAGWVYCDADTSQAATAALAPRGVTSRSAAALELGVGILGENPQGVTYTAGAAITEGDLLVCEDGGDGKVIPFDQATYADQTQVYICGMAHEDAADGATFLGSFRPYILNISKA